MITFLDTEFTDLLAPQLLSIGLVTLDGREHYAELDLATVACQARVMACSEFGCFGGVLDLWDQVRGAPGAEWESGRRTGEWLLALAAASIVDRIRKTRWTLLPACHLILFGEVTLISTVPS